MQRELEQGTYKDVRRVSWVDFTADHIAKIAGAANAELALQALGEFGTVCSSSEPRRVGYTDIERYVAWLRENGKATATINKKLHHLRSAFNAAIKRGYAARNPLEQWEWDREGQKAPRIVSDAEETALLAMAEELHGLRWFAFIHVALNTGARRGELLGLTWERIGFDGACLHFTETKGKRDRFVPINPDVVAVLRRMQAKAMQSAGPFVGMADNINREFRRIRDKAGVADVTIHDLRRSYITRLVRSGTELPTVQKLAGHSAIATTLRYYNWTSHDDMRKAVERLLRKSAG